MLAIYAIHWSRGNWGATKSFPTTCLLGVVARNAGICWNRMTLFISLFTIETANLKTLGFVEKHRVFFISHVFVGFWVSRYIYISLYIYISQCIWLSLRTLCWMSSLKWPIQVPFQIVAWPGENKLPHFFVLSKHQTLKQKKTKTLVFTNY